MTSLSFLTACSHFRDADKAERVRDLSTDDSQQSIQFSTGPGTPRIAGDSASFESHLARAKSTSVCTRPHIRPGRRPRGWPRPGWSERKVGDLI